MNSKPDIDFVDDLQVKEELLELGPTVLQERSVCTLTSEKQGDWSDGFDSSKRIFSRIIFEDDSDVDDGSESSDNELVIDERVPLEIPSVEEHFGDDAGHRQAEDVTTFIKEESSEREADERERAGAPPASGARDSFIGPEGRPSSAARGDAHLSSTTIPSTACDSDVKRFICTICNAHFKYVSHLNSHKRIHTGVKPYECKICDAKFAEAGSLKKHTRTHTGEKPFKCETCNATFSIASNLKRHTLTHTDEKPYKCEICNNKFRQLSCLKSHKLTHTGEKPFVCEICCAKFTQASNLQSHKKIHTGNRLFKCERCSASFTQANNLKKHVTQIHTGRGTDLERSKK